MQRRHFVLAFLIASSAPEVASAQVSQRSEAGLSRASAYAISFEGLDGGTIDLAKYAGKPVLVVNTASFCGFTNQYGALAKLHEKYKSKGFAVIGVPSNDFGQQEPGGPKEIAATSHEYGVRFPMAKKTVVHGAAAHRFYKWAAQERPGETPQWNFHKYLIGRDGHVAAVFPTRVKPDAPEVIAAIERELPAARQ
ncbi:MAG: glutathione peroxidase [Beijerinckiaceae bacterium]